MRVKRLIKDYFSQGNCCVVGLRGRGKDMLISNVIARRKQRYISNVDYKTKSEYIPLNLKDFDVKNTYSNFITGSINHYDYPFDDYIDIYISDSQLYFPSQFCNELNRHFETLPNFFALSRQLGQCNVHINTQNLNRLWDKIREQSDYYIMCNRCIVLFGGKIVIQTITIYDKAQSCIDRVKPFKPLSTPMFCNKETRALYRTKNFELKRNFDQAYGVVKKRTLFYINKSKYDTRIFKTILKGGK